MGEIMNKYQLKTKVDVQGFLQQATSRQVVTAIKLVLEWNGENALDLIDPAVLLQNPNLQGDRQTIVNRFPQLDAPQTGPSPRQQVALGVLDELERIVIAFINRLCDFDEHFVPIEPNGQLTKKATKLLDDILRLKSRPTDIDINGKGISLAIGSMCSAYAGLREKSLPGNNLQTLVYREAGRLLGTTLSTDPGFPDAKALFLSGKQGTTAQLKGLVGEYLGLLAAQRLYASKPSGVTWTHVLDGIFMIKICPVGNLVLPGRGGAVVPHSAPQLYMQNSNTHYGQVIGELDRVLCTRPGNNLYCPLIVLESKGGENSTNIVRAQMSKMSVTLNQIAQNPQMFCLAERVGNEWVDINGRFDLTVLDAVEIFSTGPDRWHEDQFDIPLGISSEEMDSLLMYLAHNLPAQWGQPPLEEAPVQTEI
jgi:hypothetical protein